MNLFTIFLLIKLREIQRNNYTPCSAVTGEIKKIEFILERQRSFELKKPTTWVI